MIKKARYIRADDSLHKRLKIYCALNDLYLTSVVNELLREFLELKEKKK